MKKIIYKIAILCILAFVYSNDSKAQGNLQFNKVKLVSATDTVPTNKVWKVESITYPSLTSNIIMYNSYILINGGTTQVRTYQSSSAIFWEMKYPFWLPAGTTISVSSNVNLISVIEYNITP